jgi:hypothetical protein
MTLSRPMPPSPPRPPPPPSPSFAAPSPENDLGLSSPSKRLHVWEKFQGVRPPSSSGGKDTVARTPPSPTYHRTHGRNQGVETDPEVEREDGCDTPSVTVAATISEL